MTICPIYGESQLGECGVEPSRMAGSTSLVQLILSPTTTCWWRIQWTSTLIWAEIYGLTGKDGLDSSGSISISQTRGPLSIDRRISVWGKGQKEWLLRCLALLLQERQRSIDGETVCSDSLTEVIDDTLANLADQLSACT